jgi:putative peptide zinc metalloprotease protein
MKEADSDFPLPRIRNDLQLIEGPLDLDGSPSWIVIDPVRNKYFSIGWPSFQLLSRWSTGKAKALIEKIKSETTISADIEDVKKLTEFLFANSLTVDPPSGSSSDYAEQYAASKPNFLIWLVHNYLFIRIPIVRPTRFLRATLIYVEPLFSRTTASLVFLIGLIGLYIVGRQWEEFTHTFLYFFNLQGLAFYLLSLIFVKIMHELAHAYTAVRYGCNIPTMGVAFLVMFPMLYTDTSDTWRIKEPGSRMYVGGAGMLMELYIAAIATFCWGFLPDGIFKSAAFILATTSWILSLAINLNPFMRFDGYYILSDLLGVKNLQQRSFALGKWKLRETLFHLKLPPPEVLDKSLITKLVVYAWCVWIYRFFLFLGIALLVYHFFFKALGIILFIVEILWFIVLPITKELSWWWGLRKKIIKSGRFYLTLTVLILIGGLLVVPWNTYINIPAVQMGINAVTLYTPAPGYIAENNLEEGKPVNKDDVLLVLKSPELEYEISKTIKKLEILQTRVSRIAASIDELSRLQVVMQQIQEQESKLAGLKEQEQQLVIRAPISGIIQDLEESLHVNRWINQKLPVATVLDPSASRIIGMVPESVLSRIGLHRETKFIPDDPARPSIWAYVNEIEVANVRTMDIPILASEYGGRIPVRYDGSDEMVPENSVYRVRITVSPVEKAIPDQEITGVARITGEAQSILNRIYEKTAAILIRESGF